MLIPPTWLAAGVISLSAITFAAGYHVREWRCESQVAKIERKAVIAAERARKQGNLEAIDHELERANADKQTTIREREVRTIYRDRAVPADCEPPADVGRVLDDALEAANGRAAGQSRPTVPGATG